MSPNTKQLPYAKFKKKLRKVVKKFLKGHFEQGLTLLNTLNPATLSPKFQAILSKINLIYLLGQLIDLPTLHSILEYKKIKSNLYGIKYNNILSNISHQYFIGLFESVFTHNIRVILKEMSEKDPSIWSKKLVTVILDDSIFKQWIAGLLGTDKHYGCFYSGQFNSTVYGFKVVCLGLSIEGEFHPLFLGFVPRKIADKQGKNTALKARDIAEQLVEKWGRFVSECQNEGISLPKFHLSCDNGYSDVKLSETCEKNNLIYISVPKKSHNFTIHGETNKLAHFITKFEEFEKKHIEKFERDNQKIPPYRWRVRGDYKSQNRAVVLLFFRLNKSDKVSVIYSTETNIFAKTLRHHWFDRTYVEQFFKLLKYSMKIQNTIVQTKEGFEKKLYQFMFLGFYLQFFVRYIRKRFDFGIHRKIGLEAIKRQALFREVITEILDDLLQAKRHTIR
jgi:hypothetical protein